MDQPQDSFAPRLDRIETQWSLLRRAHDASMATGSEARRLLVLRYSPAIKSYIRAIVGNEIDADEIAQDAVVRLLKGDFAGADPQRGRFRDLLKVAVRNMIRSFWQRANRRKTVDYDVDQVDAQFAEEQSDGLDDAQWVKSWRRTLMDLAWAQLREYEETHAGSVSYSVLRTRADHPDIDSTELARRVTEKIGRPVKSDAVRQQLRRARIRFCEFLVEEIAHGLDSADPERIQDELIQLGIFEEHQGRPPQEVGRLRLAAARRRARILEQRSQIGDFSCHSMTAGEYRCTNGKRIPPTTTSL